MHEAAVIKRFCDASLWARFEKRSYNAKLAIQRWYRDREGHRPKDASLASFASYARLKQAAAPNAGVGMSIRRLRAGADGKKRLKAVNEAHRALWVSLIEYNQNHCSVLRRLTRRAASHLEKAASQRPS